MLSILIRIFAFAAAICLLSVSASAGQLISRNDLTLDVAKQMAAVAMLYTSKQKGSAVIVVMDDGGHLLYLERMDDAPLGSIDVAIGKARSVVMYQRPTEVFQKMMEEGHTNVLGISGLVPWGGGVPVMWQGHMIGAIAVSGMSPEQDAAAASLAANTISGIVGR